MTDERLKLGRISSGLHNVCPSQTGTLYGCLYIARRLGVSKELIGIGKPRLAVGLHPAYRRGMSRISISHPTAFAYFLSEVSEGACLPPDSRRETVLLVVPMRDATASWVRPARARAANISSATAYSTARALYAASKPRRLRAFLRKAAWSCGTGWYLISAMEYSLHAFTSHFQFSIRCLLRLLDKCMQYESAPTREKAIERPPYACFAFRPEFEEPFSKRARMWEPQIWTVLHKEFQNPCIVRKNIRGPGLDFSEHSRMEVLDGTRHSQMFSYLRT